MKRVFNQSIGWLTAPAGVVSAIGFGKDASYLDAVMQDTPPSHVSSGIVEQLAREAVAVARLLSFSQMLYLVLVVVAAFAAARLVRGTVHGARRLGLDGARKLATVHSVANVLIVGAAAYAVLVRFLSAAPVITLAALVLGVGSSLLVFAAPLQSVWVGVGLALRRRVREGDRVTVGEHAGIVREVGLMRLYLRCADGAIVFVPNRILLRESIRIERAKNTLPVTVSLQLPDGGGPAWIDAVRRTALLSPYRVAGSSVEVVARADGAAQVVVHVWSDRALPDAKSHLETSLAAVVERHGAKTAADLAPSGTGKAREGVVGPS